MKRQLIRSNIIDAQGDALIYSTNVRLALTGGVGAALLERFGLAIQNELLCCSGGTGRQMAEVGDVFETRSPGMPWKIIFHTVATDELYYTRPETVLAILRKCVRRCVELASIKSVITSPLGAGYGDLDLNKFVRIADQVCDEYDESSVQSFAVVCRDVEEFDRLSKAARAINENWKQQG
ncbi:MAG TPA: macro domain-containing protein [Candidatus Binatia bacterium]|jgi:O-acetyl-ADP-ribose deacetylase (regulator of RNase III)|nr:macro domain-containing protein [Candidatus Binatia bacterium]